MPQRIELLFAADKTKPRLQKEAGALVVGRIPA